MFILGVFSRQGRSTNRTNFQ